jgi:hypothetical protein
MEDGGIELPSWLDNSTYLNFLHEMKGPDFLVLYAIWFALILGIVLALRRRGCNNNVTDMIGALVFLSLGAARLAVGSAHGLHKWTFLGIMMAVGTICFFVRVTQTGQGDSSSGSWWSSCSSGGGCGGGGCGGGGCGGCGG